MIRILAPSPTYAGLAAGIQFAGGEAVVDETRHAAAVAWFRRQGYRVEPVASQATTVSLMDVVAAAAQEPLEGAEGGDGGDPDGLPGKGAKKAAWVEYAEAHGIPRAEAEDLTIAQLRERLQA